LDTTADQVNPSYLTIARGLNQGSPTQQANAQSAASNTVIDDPGATPGASVANLRSGINFFSLDTSNLNRITFGSGIPTTGVRIGIFTDNHGLDMNSYTVTHTTVGAGGSNAGNVSFNVSTFNNDGNDFHFFDIKNAVAGDVFTIAGTGNGSGFSYLGGITVDVIPEPSAALLGGLGLLALLRRRA
jgi:hypothetical protein